MKNPYSSLARFLVIWYGLFQTAHILVNTRGLVQLASGSIDFPALPPPEGWAPQSIQAMTGMASVDLFNAILTLIFAYGYFRRRRWQVWLGTLTMTVSIYAAVIFTYFTVAVGAWTAENLPAYLFLTLAFVPVVLLFGLYGYWVSSAALKADG